MSATQGPAVSVTVGDYDRRADYNQRIRIEQLRTLNSYLPAFAGVHLLVGAALIYALWEVVPKGELIVWGAALAGVSLIRTSVYVYYRSRSGRDSWDHHGRNFVLGSALSGLVWGAAGALFFPQDALQYQIFILAVLVGMGAGAVSSVTAYMPAFYAYFPVSMLPISWGLFSVGDELRIGLGIMTLTYTGALCIFGHKINRSLVQSLRLRFENSALVRELSVQKEEAEQANVAKSRFLAAASHDLRQPLHALTLYTSLLDDPGQPAKTRRVVGQINASIATLQHLFNALLDVSKLDAGTLVPQIENFFLQPLFDRLANDFGVEAQQRGLSLQFEPSDVVLYTDPALLEQILRNYLSNALRYTKRGGVKVAATRGAGAVRIDVVDTGVGIPVDKQSVIFREFYQLRNPERDRSKGLGLGLAIVKRLSLLLNHPVGVQAEPDRGARFWVEVPLGTGQPAAPIVQETPAAEMASGAPALLVVIDDDRNVRESTRHLFEEWGCEVVAAASTESVLAMLEHVGRRPEGIIADYRLREGHTGLEAIRTLREQYGDDIPSLIITGDTASGPLRKLRNSGLQLLHKPVAPAKLRAFLNNVRRAAAKRD